jgi:hypothetical protein
LTVLTYLYLDDPKPRPRLCVDGCEFPPDADGENDSAYVGDGRYPPFVVFDIEQQQNLPGEYATREAAEHVMNIINTTGVQS